MKTLLIIPALMLIACGETQQTSEPIETPEAPVVSNTEVLLDELRLEKDSTTQILDGIRIGFESCEGEVCDSLQAEFDRVKFDLEFIIQELMTTIDIREAEIAVGE